MAKREIVSSLMGKGVLIDRDMLTKIDEIHDLDAFRSVLLQHPSTSEIDFLGLLQKYQELKLKKDNVSTPAETIIPGTVRVISSYEEEPKKRDVQDFVSHFTARYEAIRPILQNRKELQSLTSINRLRQKQAREKVAIIAIVSDKQVTKTGKIALTVEDPTGEIKVIITEKSESFELSKELVLDEIIGITGTCAGDVIFASSIIIPDIPIYKELKKSPDEAYAVFISDLHIGSKVFLRDSFEKFISWIRGEQGSEAQQAVAKKVKYLIIGGDVVEGVGIYPNQENDLDILDIYKQYDEFARYMRMLPNHLQLIICPGNHDAMRIAEPQPALYKDFAKSVWELPNVHMVSSPSYVNIHSSDSFPGFDLLIYHGFSFIYYADAVESIRSQGGQQRVDLIMKFLLQRRHLAPSHKSTLYLPDTKKDHLVIDKIPDFFVSGHIHRVSASNYRNVTMLNCSGWLEKTEYQEKVGLKPQPGRVLLANLQTRKVKILKFFDGEY
ncbi:MAG: DNA-directed DNA polymerase II small subunit [Candidatus Woesearchaeota archaeon]